jgi:hypothetical protein
MISASRERPRAAFGLVVAAKLAGAFLGFSALVTEIATLVAEDRFRPADFFSYFTVESNALAVLSLVAGAVAAATGLADGRLDYLRGAIALYMTTTILVFSVLLAGYSSDELTAVPWDNTVLHYLMPVIVIVDWLLTGPVRGIAYRSAVFWLTFPLAYLAYSLIRGSIVGWYPYPFMNPSHNGSVGVLVTAIVIAIVLAAITWLLARAPAWRVVRIVSLRH